MYAFKKYLTFSFARRNDEFSSSKCGMQINVLQALAAEKFCKDNVIVIIERLKELQNYAQDLRCEVKINCVPNGIYNYHT